MQVVGRELDLWLPPATPWSVPNRRVLMHNCKVTQYVESRQSNMDANNDNMLLGPSAARNSLQREPQLFHDHNLSMAIISHSCRLHTFSPVTFLEKKAFLGHVW